MIITMMGGMWLPTHRSPPQEANFLEQDDDAGSDEEDNKASVLESNGQDTSAHYGNPEGHNIQP